MRTWLALRRVVSLGSIAIATVGLGCETTAGDEDFAVQTGDLSHVIVVGSEVVHRTSGTVSNVKLTRVPNTTIRIVTWDETLSGVTNPFFAINLGQGRGWNPGKQTTYTVPLRTRSLDPRMAPRSDLLPEQGDPPALHIVQYICQPLDAFWAQIRAAGGEVHQYLHGNSQIVRGDVTAIKRIAQLPFVRAVTPMVASDKVDPRFKRRDNVTMAFVSVLVDATRVADRANVVAKVTALGGQVRVNDPKGILIEGSIAASKIDALSEIPELLWIEEAKDIEEDYDIARQQGGADYLEALPDASPALPEYTGVGIRGHIMEGIDPTHGDFVANDFRVAPISVDNANSDSHGMQTFGIVFGSGAGNARAKGQLPNGQGYFTHNNAVFSSPNGGRSVLVGKLIADHKVMFQTASWGNGLVTSYNAKSAEMDALILMHDIPITQSQSNAGSTSSRPQAWAKNIISVGALYHFGTATPDDDKWNGSGSIGPAADGSIKPDLSFYFDKTITTTVGGGYSQSFGGTSGATPTVAGHVGLTIEMWTEGVFGNPIIPKVAGEDMASFRFKNRPHFTTTKALLINSAKQHVFDGETHDRTRVHQGWGVPNLEQMHKRRVNMLVVNETDVLKNLEKKTYTITVPANAPDLRATLVYADKEATVPATIQRINNLDLKVIAPSGTIYWGNNGLKAGMTSVAGGVHNTLDTVENVFVKSPEMGTWTVEVIADEINADTHAETTDTDADYALVVTAPPP